MSAISQTLDARKSLADCWTTTTAKSRELLEATHAITESRSTLRGDKISGRDLLGVDEISS